ncbi:MAG: teichoic acid biosynthesis protein B [Prevotella sp.]|nr:teichoic acid biosynthesis protein B [Prevotella sp.]
MKKVFLILLAAAFMTVLPATAQTETTTQKEKIGDRFVRLGKKAVKEMEKAANNLGDAIGFEDRVDGGRSADSVKVDGTWYMPLYTVNLYKGGDLDIYRSACRSAFEAKYPAVEIVSVVVPQQEWLSDTYKKNNKVTGYVQTLYCYVLGKDDSDGYVNARFVFQRQKEVGKQYEHIANKWPQWESTDVIPMAAYEVLKTK